MYVFGGAGVKSIEACHVGADQPWSIIIEDNQLVGRYLAAISIVKKDTIAVFGGGKKDGYLFNVASNEITPILGQKLDIKFNCLTEVKQVTKQTFVTIGKAGYHLKKIVLYTNKSGSYLETRAVADYGQFRY